MQININIILLATLVRTLVGITVGVILWLSAREVTSGGLRATLLVLMSYFITFSVYRMVKAIRLRKEMEKFLEEQLDNEDPKS
jgi:hypothetical protein